MRVPGVEWRSTKPIHPRTKPNHFGVSYKILTVFDTACIAAARAVQPSTARPCDVPGRQQAAPAPVGVHGAGRAHPDAARGARARHPGGVPRARPGRAGGGGGCGVCAAARGRARASHAGRARVAGGVVRVAREPRLDHGVDGRRGAPSPARLDLFSGCDDFGAVNPARGTTGSGAGARRERARVSESE